MKRYLLTAAALALLTPATAHAAADQYELGKPHTQIMFSVDHMGFTKSWGRFLGYDGKFTFDKDHPEQSTLTATIHTDTLDMGDPVWNQHTKEFFHTDKFPDMTFKSTAIHVTGPKTADITGDLTLLGVTKPETLHVTFTKAERAMFGKYLAGFHAETTIKRSDFGMKDGLPFVGDDVNVVIEAEGDRVDQPGQTQYNQ